MNKKLFSGGVFIENLRRVRLFTVICAAVIAIFEAFPAIISVVNAEPHGDAKTVIYISDAGFLMPILAISAPVFLTMLLFSRFNKRAYSDFAHSLPYTRTCIFLTNTVTVYAAFTVLLLLSAFSGVAAYALFPARFIINFVGFWKMFLTAFSAGAFVISAFLIAVSLTGTVFSNITAAGLLMFFPRYILIIITSGITSIVPLFGGNLTLPLLSPQYNTLVGIIFGMGSFSFYGSESTVGYEAVIYTLCAALVYTAAGFVIFLKRKSETAESPASGKKVQAAIRVLVALVFSIPATALVVSGDSSKELGFILYALALVAYFAYEAISSHTVRNLAKTLPALLAVVVLNLACAGVIFGVSDMAGSYTPSAGEIDGVCISSDTPATGSSEWKNLPNASDVVLKDSSTKGIVSEVLTENVRSWKEDRYETFYRDDDYVGMKVTVIQNGFRHFRVLYFSREQSEKLLAAMSENAEYRDAYMNLPDPIPETLTVDQFGNLANIEKEAIASIKKEVKSLGFETWYKICEGEYSLGGDGNEIFAYVTYSPKGYEKSTVSLCLPVKLFPETYNLLLKNAYETQDVKKLETLLKLPETGVKEDNPNAELNSFWLRAEVVIGDRSYEYSYDYLPVTVGADGEEADTAVQSTGKINEKMKKLFRDAAAEESVPVFDRYIYIAVNSDFYDTEKGEYLEYGELNTELFLPVPEDFELWDYPFLYEADETVEHR